MRTCGPTVENLEPRKTRATRAAHNVGDTVIALCVVQLIPAATLRVLLGVEDEVCIRGAPVRARERGCRPQQRTTCGPRGGRRSRRDPGRQTRAKTEGGPPPHDPSEHLPGQPQGGLGAHRAFLLLCP